jgi:hypothetical protein
MIPINDVLNHLRVYALVLMLVLTLSSCTKSPKNASNKPIDHTIEVTQLITVLVTREVTQEVTREVKVLVTVTPSNGPSSTLTPTISSTIAGSPGTTSAPLGLTILENSDCLYGPGTGYLYKYSVSIDIPMEAIGRNWDGSWLYIQNIDGWNPCWIQTTSVKLALGDINELPLVYSKLPYSNQYNSPDASAHRDDNEVTISWKADWMSLDDYRGYLIEAWLCLGGVQVFDPISYVPPLANNVGTLSIKMTDDFGCTLPSSARIYSAQKQGYSNWSNIPWPPAVKGN